MSPQTALSLDASDQSFYNWLVNVCAYIVRTYGVTLFPQVISIAEPGSPAPANDFYLVGPTFKAPLYVGQAYMGIFGSDYASMAGIALGELSYPDPAPQPLKVAPVVVTPAPPANPIGDSFQDGSETDYVDLGSPSIAIGGVFTAPDGRIFLKEGRRTPFGIETWFVTDAGNKPAPATANSTGSATAAQGSFAPVQPTA